MSVAEKRRKDAYTEYPVKFANGEVLYLPPRRVRQRPVFKAGKLVDVSTVDETMTPELQGMCDSLIELSDGSTDVSGKSLELLLGIAAYLILKGYDVDDNDLSALLEIRTGTSELDNAADQWPAKIMRWVIGGDEVTQWLQKN